MDLKSEQIPGYRYAKTKNEYQLVTFRFNNGGVSLMPYSSLKGVDLGEGYVDLEFSNRVFRVYGHNLDKVCYELSRLSVRAFVEPEEGDSSCELQRIEELDVSR